MREEVNERETKNTLTKSVLKRFVALKCSFTVI